MYQALYRKYRPKSFDDVVGQEHITSTLKNEVLTGKIAHAYLFCGSRGTGKTTCAKILAKAVNCPDLRDGSPCGECEICRGIDDGSLLDVLEIDAASNNGVDNIRQLREDAFFTPSMAKYRVYIIDETHMLSTGAFNALLKIMEEPPSHVLFILATTEAHKVPATILSRCQRFDFHRIKSGDIARYLEKIAGKEGVELTHDGALLIGRLSDGGMRDAVSLLDQCISQGSRITAELVSRTAGLAGSRPVLELA
ncbi:MAG: DNA polymerase III subunit gamma/tau, partial [Oscillospiraceae bacterium]|nr:DNA polymerase III subunit gamma/tau [Oscillospiraceae bacterium]